MISTIAILGRSWLQRSACNCLDDGVSTCQQIIPVKIVALEQFDDPGFDNGAIHNFLITYESARQGAKGDFTVRSREHFNVAVELTGGQLASPYVSMAEAVSVSKQDRTEFESLLKRALAIDTNVRPEWRLNNKVMQRRARWLLSQQPLWA